MVFYIKQNDKFQEQKTQKQQVKSKSKHKEKSCKIKTKDKKINRNLEKNWMKNPKIA
jgi:hypothetical protein